MKPNHFLPAVGVFSVLQLAVMQAWAAPLALSQSPLFLASARKANVLMLYGNSNSMDSDPTGKAVGSASDASKSEIARNAIQSVVANYTGYINMGLMAYQQNALVTQYLHDAQYDVSYNPSDFDPAFQGARNSQTKKFAINNPTSAGDKIFFNVNLPYYAPSNQGSGFCYSSTACTDASHDFKGSGASCNVPEHPVNGPWDEFTCFDRKQGTSNTLAKSAGGYAGDAGTPTFKPTDSDLGQGITDFGKRMSWQPVSVAWFNNASPGMGYLHLPVAELDAAQAAAINKKLARSQFVDNQPTNDDYPLQNAGLSPLEGAIATANAYFAGTLSAAGQGGPVAAPPNSCSKNFVVTLTDGLPSVRKNGAASADVAANLLGLTTEVTALRGSASKAETYVVGFALPYGVSITQLDRIAAAGGSDSAYDASDTATLNSAFSRIFADIMSKTSAASSVALNSQSLATGGNVFQARFSTADWSGQLLKLGFDAGGALQRAPLWDAGRLLAAPVAASRTIVTIKPSTGKGIAFRWPAAPATPGAAELDVAQSTLLSTSPAGVADSKGRARLDYLRGSSADEGEAGLMFRRRPTSKLGDIVNSAPHYIGAPAADLGAPGYRDYVALRKNRSKMIYVGANDGMLHGFDMASGEEKLAYVPGGMYANLSKLTAPVYGHRYFVDGTPGSGDVQYAGGAWNTVLVSGMGAGARGIFALNVSDPGLFTQANADRLVNFEFTEANDADVGYIAGAVSVVKLNNGKWAALFGNGYNGTGRTGQSALFLVDIETGALIKKIQTGAGSAATPNALSTPLAIDDDQNGTVDTVYAGDLEGNMWKFDLSGAVGQWGVAYKLFQAPQPITGAPDAGAHPSRGYMVYFGTGKYLESGDVASTPGNAIYAIWDKGAAVTAARLLEQSYTQLAPVNGKVYRTLSNNAIDWSTHLGWFAALPNAGERIVSAPQLRDGRVIFTSIIPSNTPCSPGGTSWLNQMDWLGGTTLAKPQFDTSNDGKIGAADALVAGQQIEGVVSEFAIQANGIGGEADGSVRETNLANGSLGDVVAVPGAGDPKRSRRLSWKQVK